MKSHATIAKIKRTPWRSCATVLSPALLLTLVACSGGPSGSDVDKAVRTYMSNSQVQSQRISGIKNTLGEIHDVKKLDCKSESDVLWRCDVELDMTEAQLR